MATNSLGQLTLDLVARTGGFVRGLDKAERRSKKWRRQVQKQLRGLGNDFAKFSKVAAGAGVAAAGAFTIMAKEGLQFVDSQAKMATRLGSTIDDLRAVQIAASDFGIEQERLTRSLQSYTKRLGDAARGTGEAQKAYEALGLEAKDLVNLPLPEQLALIAERIADLDSAAERTSIADRLMSGGRRMVNLFEEGGGAIRAAVKEVDEFGLSLNEIDAKAVENANDAIGRIPRALEPLRNQIAINLAQPMIDVARLFNDAAKASNNFAAETVEGMAVVVETIAEVLDGLDDVRTFLLQVQRFDQAVSAGAEQVRLNVAGQGMGRMQGYGLDNPPPKTGPETAEYNRLNAELIALEEGGNFLRSSAEFMQSQAEKIRQGPARRAALQAGFDSGLGMDGGISNEAIAATEGVAEVFDRMKAAAEAASKALEDFNPSMNDEVQDILDRAGEGSSIDASGILRDAWGNALPTLQRELDAELKKQVADFKSAQNLQAGLEIAAQAFTDGATHAAEAAWASVQGKNAEETTDGVLPTGEQADAGSSGWSSIAPRSADDMDNAGNVISWSSGSSSKELESAADGASSPVARIAALVEQMQPIVSNISDKVGNIAEIMGNGRTPITLTINGPNGTDSSDGEVDDNFVKMLADALSGVAAGSR